LHRAASPISRKLGLILIALLFATLGCQAAANAWQARFNPTPTPTTTFTPTETPLPPTLTPTFTPSPAPTYTPSPQPPTLTPTATASPTPRPTASAHHFEVFGELWTLVKENYLYEDFNGLDWDKVYEEYRQRITDGLSDEEFYQAMADMIERLGDEHSAFLDPTQASEFEKQYQRGYSYSGIGILTAPVPERQRITIILVFPDSPAEKAGLKLHDSILSVDGQPIIDEEGVKLDLLRGEQGSTVTIIVQSPGGEPRQLTLTRERITGETPVPYQVLTSPGGKRIGYILMTTFASDHSNENVRSAIETMSSEGKLDGLILDNRFNSGGLSTEFSDTIAYFADGKLGTFLSREGTRSITVKAKNVANSQNIPLVVLVGQGTASFGEIFSGILNDIDRAYLIGETTDGNVELLYIYPLSDGSQAWIAHDVFRPLKHRDQNWEQTGIIPDMTAISSWDETTIDTDPVILAALEHFDQ
jgi:carboxyl-terminal processing protease